MCACASASHPAKDKIIINPGVKQAVALGDRWPHFWAYSNSRHTHLGPGQVLTWITHKGITVGSDLILFLNKTYF